MRYILMVMLILGQSCAKHNPSQSEENIQVQGDTAQNTLSDKFTALSEIEVSTLTNFDTLTPFEFISLFKEREHAAYNLYKDSTWLTSVREAHYHWDKHRLMINDTLKQLNISGYPLYFKESNNQGKWLTTLYEGGISYEVRLYTFDKYFNLIDRSVLTYTAGDEGYRNWAFGEFKNDSTYYISEFSTGFDTDSIERVDHSCIIIHNNGKIDKLGNCR